MTVVGEPTEFSSKKGGGWVGGGGFGGGGVGGEVRVKERGGRAGERVLLVPILPRRSKSQQSHAIRL